MLSNRIHCVMYKVIQGVTPPWENCAQKKVVHRLSSISEIGYNVSFIFLGCKSILKSLPWGHLSTWHMFWKHWLVMESIMKSQSSIATKLLSKDFLVSKQCVLFYRSSLNFKCVLISLGAEIDFINILCIWLHYWA